MLDLKVLFEAQINTVIDGLIQDVKDELEAQGHRATGKLIDSIRKQIDVSSDTIAGFVYMQEYYKYVDSGFRPKLSRAYIDALVEWMKSAGVGIGSSDKERRGIAFAIYNVAKNTGHPTPGSFQFSSNGRRKGFIAETVTPLTKQLPRKIDFGKVREYFVQTTVQAVKRSF